MSSQKSILFFGSNINTQLSSIKRNEFQNLNITKACLWLAAIPIAGVIGANSVQAQSIVPAPDGTNTIVTPQDNRFDITGGKTSGDGANLFHSFTEFGLTEGQIANFLSRPDILNILARINGGNPSFINGLIQVTGGNSNLFLMNPSGIIFGSNASLNVPAAFTATTANGIGFGANWFNAIGSNNYANLVGKPNAFAFTMNQPGNIVNLGNLGVGIGQNLNLLAGMIINTGQLSAPEGNITITAVPGESLVRLSQPGYLLSLEVSAIANNSNLPNSWNLSIASLPQMLTGGSVGSATGVIVNQNGSVKLTGSGINIPQKINTNIVAGNINVSGKEGGNINILGDKIGVIGGNINASGSNNGGTVRIGGDYQGKGNVPNAGHIFISKDSTISADSLVNGNGGRVIVWADETTLFYGNITTRGGSKGGNGGFVETSGKNSLEVAGAKVDASAIAGEPGTWLLDPRNITIGTSLTGGGSFSGANPDIFTANADDAIVSTTDIENALNLGTSVTITTGNTGSQAGNITVVDSISRTQGANATLKLDAANKISVANADITNSSASPLNVILSAGSDILIVRSSIQTNGGNIELTSANGGIDFRNADLNSANNSGSGGNITLQALNQIKAGAIDATGTSANGDIRITGSEIDFQSTVAGGVVTLEPADANQSVRLANDSIDGAALDILQDDIDNLTDVKSIIIGRTDGNSGVTVDPTGIFFNTPVTVQGGGSIAVNGDISTNGENLTIISKNSGIKSSGGEISSRSGSGNSGAIVLNAKGDIITANIRSNPSEKGNGGDIKLISSNGAIDTSQGIVNGSADSGSGGSISMTAPTSITTGKINAIGTSGGGNINLTSDEINFTAGANSVQGKGTIELQPLTITQNLAIGEASDTGNSTLDITQNDINAIDKTGFSSIIIGQGIKGNGLVTLDNFGNLNVIDDVKNTIDLTLNAGSANVTFSGAIGNSQPLGNLTVNNTDKVTLNGNITTASNRTINLANSNTVTLNGDTILTADEINFNQKANSVSGNGKLILQPTNTKQDIAIGGSSDSGSATLDLTATDITALSNGFSSITIGRDNSESKITIAGNVNFKDPVTIQSPKGAGAIAFSGGTISGEDNASISLIANQTITVGGITAPAGISIKSNSGSIDSSAGILDATNAAGKGGDVNVNAAGNVTFFGIVARGNSDGGKISIASGGNVAATTAGDIAADGKNGKGGDIIIDSKGNILTDDIFSLGTLGGGKITLNSGGTIDFTQVDKSLNTPGGTISCAGVDISCSGNGKGGDITFKATKDIITGEVNSSGSLGGGKIDITSTDGKVFTGLNSSSSGGDGGEINVKSPVKITATGINSTGNPGTGNITLTSNEINFSGAANSVKGKGIIQLQPFTESQKLNISNTDFAAFADGFSSIIIGRDNGSGIITISNPFTFSDPTIIQSPSGSILVNGAIKGIDNADITIIGNTNLNNDITTADRDITIKGNTTLGNNVTVSTGAVSGGNIKFNGTINGNPDLTLEVGTGNIAIDNAIGNNNRIGNLSINSATNVITKDITAASITQKLGYGNTSFGALNTNTLAGINLNGNIFSFDGTTTTTNGGTVTINNSGLLTIADIADMNLDGAFKQTGTGATATAADITTTNDNISFSNPVNLLGNITLNPGNADINFGSTVDGGFDLKLIAGIGDITFTGNVGNQTRIGNLIIQNVNNLKADRITAASITQTAGTGTTTLGNLDTNTPTGINLKGNSFNLKGNVNTTNFGGFTIDNSSPLNLAANTKFTLDGAFNQIGKGAVSTAANITTTNDDITFSSPVTLTRNITLNTGTGAGDIKFGNTVDGSFDLDLIAGTGDIIFAGNVGNQIRIGNLIIENANNLQADKITAASINQKEGTGTSVLGNLDTNTPAGINLKGNNFNLNGAVTTTNSGNFTIDNQNILDIAANADFKLDGEFKQIGKGAVTTAGDITTSNDNITFNSPVTLKGNVAFNTDKGAGDIKFGSTIDGGFDLNLRAGTGNITVIGAVGSQTRIGNLTIDNANDVKAGAITAASINQKASTGITTLGALNTNTPAGISLNGNNFSLNGSIATTNSGTFTINNSGQVNIADAADMKLDGIFNQTGKGAIFTSGDIITNNKDIRFTSPVTLTGNVTFNPGTATIAFGSSLAAGNNPLTLTAGEIDFSGPVSGSNTLVLQPATANRNVAIGTFISVSWNLTSAEIALLQNGFSSITIGRIDSIGQTNVNNITFQDPVVIRSGAGSIAQNGPIFGIDNASITLDSNITTLNSDITTTGGNITVGRNVLLAKDVNISTSKGNINFLGPIDGNQQLTLNASGNVIFNAAVGAQTPLGNLNIISAGNALVAGGINTTNSLQFNIPVLLTADSIFSTSTGKDITFNALVAATKANNFILNPNTGNVTFNSGIINVGDISIINANNFTAADNIQAASLLYAAGKGNINLLGNVTTNGNHGVDLRTNGTIRTNNIISNGSNITIVSNKNPITTATIDASSTTKTGGNLFVSSLTAAVITNDLRARGVEAGGNVTVISGDRINTGNIDVSASIGKGGSILLDPPNDIQVGSINAQGGTSGTGGNVDITTARYFRAIGAFSDRNNINASISTAGGTGGGSIIIRHGGGDLNTPFVVGNSTTPNGTLGALTSGEFTISPVQSFPGLYTLGNIQIITSTQPPIVEPVTPIVAPVTPIVEPVTPIVEPVTPIVEPVTPIVEPVTPIVEPVTPIVEPVTPIVEPVTPIVEPVTPIVEPVTPIVAPVTPNNSSLPLPPFSVLLSVQVNPLLRLPPLQNLPRNNPLNLILEPLPQLPSLTQLSILRGFVPESTYLIASPSLSGNYCQNSSNIPTVGMAKQGAKCISIASASSSNDVQIISFNDISRPINSSVSENTGQFVRPINVGLGLGIYFSEFLSDALFGLGNNTATLYSYHQGSNSVEGTFTFTNTPGTAAFIYQPPVVVEGTFTGNPGTATAAFIYQPPVVVEGTLTNTPVPAYSVSQIPVVAEGSFTNTPNGTPPQPIVVPITISPNVPETPGTQNSTTVSTNVAETPGSINTPTNAGLNGSEVAIQPFTPSEQVNSSNTSTTSTNNPNQLSTSSQTNSNTPTASSSINRGSTSVNSSDQNNQNVSRSSPTVQRGQTTTSSGQNNQNTSASNTGSQTREAGTSTGQNTQISSTAPRGERGQPTTSSGQVSNSSPGNQTASSETSTGRQNANNSASSSVDRSNQPISSSSTTQTNQNSTASSGQTARANRPSTSVEQTDPNTIKIAQRAQECEQQVDYIRRTKAGQRSQTNYQKLIECYLQNLEIARKFKNQQWEQYALNNLAVTYFVVGDYAKSIELHQEHLELARKMENRMGEALALSGIGAAYAALGNYKKAIKFYSQSLAITESIPAPQWEGPTLRNLGNAYLAQKNYDKAIEYQEKSLAFSRQNQDRYGEAQALGNLGNAYSALGEYQKAIEYHEQSLNISREIGDRLQEAQGLLNLGTTYSAEGNYAKALEYHQQSLAIVQELHARLGEGIALTNLGDALFHLRQLIESERRLYEGVEVWESLRAGLGNDDESKVSIYEIQSNTYRNLQEVLSDQSKIDAALEISEKGRARAYSDLLARRLGDNSNRQTTIEPPNIDQIKQIAKKQNATLVEYSITYETFNVKGKRETKESELFIWVVKPTGEVAFRRVNLKFLWQEQNTSIASLVSTTREAIGLRGDPLTSAAPPDPIDINDQEQQLKLLHKLLIQPIADLLPNNPEDHVIFIPQESLFLVPFAALQDESGKYLIEQHTILTAPAIQVLNLTDKQRQRVSGSGALVIGNPTMPKFPGKNGEPGQQLESLPGAEKEAIEIATLLNTQAITGDRATKLSILPELPKARIIHFATHGLLDDFRNSDVPGAIALAPSGQDDGFLTSSEIINLKLNAELVVLSACNTGKGKITGDGVIGLSRALIAAGVPSVVVSLWAVPDAPTAELMTEFYKHLQQNPDKAQALRQAMLATMKNNPDPKNWAAFTLIGEAE